MTFYYVFFSSLFYFSALEMLRAVRHVSVEISRSHFCCCFLMLFLYIILFSVCFLSIQKESTLVS